MSQKSQTAGGRQSWIAWCAASLAALMVMPESHAGDDPTATIRVLCYNIHYGQGNDGEYDLQRLAATIKRQQPDLVALQEVDVGVKRSDRVHERRCLAS